MRGAQEESFREFAGEAMPRLRRVALGICRDPHEADDLVQLAMERLYVRWPRMGGVESPYAYARTTLVRALIDERRTSRWRRETSVAEIDDSPAPDAVSRSDTSHDVRNALTALTDRQRACVVLRHYEGLSVAESARILGISEGTIKSTTSDALSRLRSHLQEHAPSARRGTSS
ncbi:SigE family RNA polymerase sigma factor [Janibacter sp. Y6]|uniref:SigE family RNA polymerase sigma factor n=1 Tax=Janibacter sp. Y6 TaxID=2913552 RepID=UPI0034A0D5BA